MYLFELLTVLSVLCQGSDIKGNNNYETECQSYYISCDSNFVLCELKYSTLFDMQPSPIQRF